MNSEQAGSNALDQLPALSSAGDDFHSMLSHAIDSARKDDVQLRNVIYEVVRTRLQRQGWLRQPPISILEMRLYFRALEAAIVRIESDALEAELRTALTKPETSDSDAQSEIIEIQKPRAFSVVIQHEPLEAKNGAPLPSFLSPAMRPPPRLHEPKMTRSTIRPMLGLTAAAILGGLLYALLAGRIELSAPQNRLPLQSIVTEPASTSAAGKEPSSEPEQVVDQRIPSVLPTVYGVYAVSNGQLSELSPLPISVPDQRVFMSALISIPSRVTQPDGKLVFIAFRRDLATNAPERVDIRVVARVARALAFDPKGKPILTNLDAQWAVRGNSYGFRVAPLKNHPDIIIIRPESDEFAFPAGRYALVLKGQAYDFSVGGPITDPAQCLERTEALNGAIYSECHNR